GATVLATGAGIRLLKCLEHDLLLLGSNTDARVGYLEGDGRGALAQDRMIAAPAARDGGNAQAHAAGISELEGVREQVLEHLLHPLLIGDDAASELGVELHVEGEPATISVVPEGAGHGFEQRVEEPLRRLDGDGARLDLGQVEDIA